MDRIELLHGVILGFGGLPVLWMGDELGLLNDPDWAADPAHGADNRWAHRPRMPWPATDEHGISARLRHLAGVRRELPHLHAAAPTRVLEPLDRGVFTVLRDHPRGRLLMLANVTPELRRVRHDAVTGRVGGEHVDHLSGVPLPREGDDLLLRPYQVVWLTVPGP